MMIIGVDPGLVHTGMVFLSVNEDVFTYGSSSTIIQGIDAGGIASHCEEADRVYVEDFRVRGGFGTNAPMLKGLGEIKVALPNAEFLDNWGVKTVITNDVLRLLGLEKFSMATNHQDLKSAARILLLGMAKDPETNRLLYRMVERQYNLRDPKNPIGPLAA